MTRIEETSVKLQAIGIAAGVFAQISEHPGDGDVYPPRLRTLAQFKDACDLVFKAADIEAIDWEREQCD